MPGPEVSRRSGNIRLAGSLSIATGQSTNATSYAIGNLTTPDRIQNVVLPANGLIGVAYQAIWQNDTASNARAAIFIGANQLVVGVGTGAPGAQNAAGPAELNDDAIVYSENDGLRGTGGVGASTEVTTGQAIGTNVIGQGGLCWIFAAAGTYDISVQFKNNAAGNLTVKNRHLWVLTIG